MGWVDPERLREELVLVAQNSGDYYPHDPAGAVGTAFTELMSRVRHEFYETYREIEKTCVEDVQENWENCPNCGSPKCDCECDYVDED